jgi:hypothetical protein
MRRDRDSKRTAISPVKKEPGKMNTSSDSSRRSRTGLFAALAATALLAIAVVAAPTQAAFDVKRFDVTVTNQDGSPVTQAGSHPYAVTSEFEFNSFGSGFQSFPDGEIRDILIEQMQGFIGDVSAVPTCSTADFLAIRDGEGRNSCSNETVVGIIAAQVIPFFFGPGSAVVSIHSIEPPPGIPLRLGFTVLGVSVAIDAAPSTEEPYNIIAGQKKVPQTLRVFGGKVQLWGNPSSPVFDHLRNDCGTRPAFEPLAQVEFIPGPLDTPEGCPSSESERPFLTVPRSCTGPGLTSYEATSWQNPGVWVTGSEVTHDNAVPPNPQGFTGCGKLGYAPTIESQTTTDSTETGSGLEFSLEFHDEGLKNPSGLAQSDTKKAVVALPEGMTINPSIGEGLGVCSPTQLDAETLNSASGEGCPNASKFGTVHFETPIVNEAIGGELFLAQQDDPTTSEPGAENPFDTLIAFYILLRNPNLGVLAKLPVKLEPDPKTGQLIATLDDIPQFPVGEFSLHLREGQRAPLVSPPTCGVHQTVATLYPWADPDNPRTVTSDFEITSGIGGGACPPGGVPPFNPRFEAGSVNNNAGSFSPFNMRLIRQDGEQDMTKFSAILPPGELGSLAGVSKCPDSAVDVAKAKTGREELAAPSCPANSLIGHTLAGAGVGSALTYVGGQVYLGGPYKGAPLSVISITPAVAGPFDAGTVVVRLGLTLNPKTAEVEVDGAASDPIPHIIKGIVLKVRDLRVYVDRPNFTLNPTSCDESSARATLFGSFVDVFDPADDRPVDLATRFQAANCLNLGFKPRLNLNLKGGSKRGGHPGLSAIYRPRPGDANVEGLVVRLPRSAFLDQAHIRTICTRVQFAQDNCPKAAQYGYIRAWTPLLDEPLEGPAWLRSSDHKLPDLVFDLHGIVDIEVSTRLDSAKGGIRATLDEIPDAPLSLVVLRMQGGKKGLIVNSRDLCAKPSRANVEFSGHNGKRHDFNPVMRAQCGGKGQAARSARIARASATG